MIVKLNGRTIKIPHSWEVERYRISKAERVASGDMVMDTIALKRKFLVGYTELSGRDLDAILNIVYTDNEFINLEYEENGKMKSAVVYCGPIRAKKYRTNMGWYWVDVSFNLIEK
jgi:hypothetical protein